MIFEALRKKAEKDPDLRQDDVNYNDKDSYKIIDD